MDYNRNDIQSIINHAMKLVGRTLREACGITGEMIDINTGKGNFGNVVEERYFQYSPNSDSKPDFHEVGLELKSSQIKQLQNKEYRAKERLVLNVINYFNIIEEDFNTSAFYQKNAHLLLIFYLHEKGVDILDLIIKIVGDWKFPDSDLAIIKRDWDIIKKRVDDGEAHKLSEGDTFYLGACTKGGKGGNLRAQPKSDILAKQRAYSFKHGYVNHIIAKLNKNTNGVYGKIIKDPKVLKVKTIEDVVVGQFEPYIGKRVDKILLETGVESSSSKQSHALITKSILGVMEETMIEEFEKAEVIVRTVRLDEDNLPVENISFPAFDYIELVNEEDWESSAFNSELEHKFFFVFFKYEGEELYLDSIKFWNMPYEDRQSSRSVWERTRQIVSEGNIVKGFSKSGSRKTNFPGTRYNHVSHARPHGRDSADTSPLPVPDKFTGANEYTKYSFWLNDSYVRDSIYLSK